MRRLYILRLAVLLLPLFAGYAGLARHLYGLQVTRHATLLAEAQKCYTVRKRPCGQRGRVFDVSGQAMLAGNIICRDILAEPQRFPEGEQEDVIRTLSELLGVGRKTLRRRFNSGLVEVTVARGVDLDTVDALKRLNLPGIRWTDSFRRFYAKGQLLADMLGYVDYEGRGVYGLEYLLDDLLAPVAGSTVYERDRRGQRLQRGRYEVEREARDGMDVYLTIEEPIQRIVEEELERMGKEFGVQSAYAVMIRPQTGAVLAIAQYPSFDPNDRRTMVSSACWGMGTIQHMFEPGSVMKGLSIAGALDFGVVGEHEKIDCEETGRWVYGGGVLTDTHHNGVLEVWEILRESSNIGAGKIGALMGNSRLYNTLRRFGLRERTGLGVRDLIGWRPPFDRGVGWSETSGLLKSTKHWYPITPTRIAIGYGVTVTPIQLASAYSALANGGVRMEPRLIDRMVHPVTRRVMNIPPRVAGIAVRPETAAIMTRALVSVTGEEGTAPKAAVPGFQVAGKTGTAYRWISDKSHRGGGYYSRSKYLASFVGYVPADKPEFVLAIMADEPNKQKGHYGGTVAAPTFSRIAARALRYLQVGAPEEEPGAEEVNNGQLARLP
jgi:cell division protein FtsI/penicillin-binding protein 2